MDEKGKFVRVRCVRCGNEQVIFGKSSTRVKCGKCNKLLVRVGGGRVRIRAVVREVLK
jgi:small subunit ribosomal protein S27e